MLAADLSTYFERRNCHITAVSELTLENMLPQ